MNPKAWTKNNPQSFYAWLKDVQPRIINADGVYRAYNPTPTQREIIDKILLSKNNSFVHTMSLICMPRRHGKTVTLIILLLFFFTTRKNFNIVLHGATEQHCRRTQFSTLTKIIRNTPLLRKSISENNLQQWSIHFPELGNTIQLSAQNVSAAFGSKINILQVSDLHSHADLSSFNALQAGLLDSENSLLLIDSNIDYIDGAVHGLQQQAKEDPTIYSYYRFYKDWDDYAQNAPEWIDRSKAKRLQKTTLPTDFMRDVLGQRADSMNALFPNSIIQLSKSKYQVPVSDISELVKGRAYRVGAGLDRAKSLFQTSKSADATVWTVVAKVSSVEHGEPEYYVLNSQKISPNTSMFIKKIILRDHQRYKINNITLEAYETGDLSPWLSNMLIPHELVPATETVQNSSFPEFHRACAEGRFHFSDSLKQLESEMRTFAYRQRPGGKYSFGHASKKFHDDFVYSCNYSIYSLRSEVLSLFTLGNIMCNLKSPKRRFCFLMGGDKVLLCAHRCDPYSRVESMYQTYKSHQLDSEISIVDFLNHKVKRVGARISQAV
jgi:hypothetical protein